MQQKAGARVACNTTDMEGSIGNLRAYKPVALARDWLDRVRNRLSLSMGLSVLLHVALAAFVLLVLVLLYQGDSRQHEAREITVKLVASGQPVPPKPPSGSTAGDAGNSQQNAGSTSGRIDDAINPLKGVEKTKVDAIGRKIGNAAAQTTAQTTANNVVRMTDAFKRDLEGRKAGIGKAIAQNKEEFAKLQKQAKDALAKLADSKDRAGRWVRWMVQQESIAGMQNASGRLLIVNHPRPGQYTYIVNVATSPSQKLGPKPANLLVICPATEEMLHLLIAVCQRADITLKPGTFVPYVVFPRTFEDKLKKLEREEMEDRKIEDEKQIKRTTFILHNNGTLTLRSMVPK